MHHGHSTMLRLSIACFALWLASPASAGGGAHILDDDAPLPAGVCHIESWMTFLSEGRGLAVANPACTFMGLPRLAIAAAVQKNWGADVANAPFALDMVYFITDFVQGGLRGQIAENVGLTVQLGHALVRHLMDNQTLRQPTTPPAQARASFADADTLTAEAALRLGGSRAYVEVGADVEITDRFVTITNPTNPAFVIQSQPDVRAERVGAYLQWRGSVGAAQFELGGRIDRTEQSVGVPLLGAAVPMGPRALAAAFIASGRQADDTTIDAVARAWIEGGALLPCLTLARKTRVPNVLERFAWLPTETSFGLADGNIYVGNQAPKPEVAIFVAAMLAGMVLVRLVDRPAAAA